MKHSILIFCCFLITTTISSQNKKTSFPQNVVGVYKGNIHISSSNGSQTIPMEFHLTPTKNNNKFNYVLIYNGSPRNYTLVVKDHKKGIYEIDENNGIILPSKMVGNTLYSFFEVQGNLLSSRLAFAKNQLEFEILFIPTKNKTTTGGTSTSIPTVYGYPISTVQKATLKKDN